MSKIILIDGGGFTHISIFQWGGLIQKKNEGKIPQSTLVLPSHYTYFSMLISAFKKIQLSKDDTVIIALDGRNSWRKDYYAPYKAQRQDMRESHTHIDWTSHYAKINETNEQLNLATKWHFLRLDKIEADDIIAVACKYFKDNECIVLTGDADLDQLTAYPNVKIFSMNIKYRNQKGGYKFIKNPYKIIADKVKKGDKSDNIIVKDTDTEHDFELRHFIINLLELPDFVTEPVINELKNLPNKNENLSELPFPNSLAKRFPEIYTDKNYLPYEYCIKKQQEKEEKKKETQRKRYKKIKTKKTKLKI